MMMGEMWRFCHLLAVFLFLLTCSGIAFLPGVRSSDEVVTDSSDATAAADARDSTHGLTRDLTKDSAHDLTKDSTHDSTDDQTHEMSHDPLHDLTHVPTHDQTHDPTHVPTHEQTHVPTHDQTHVPTHDQTHVPTHDSAHDTTHDTTTEPTHVPTDNTDYNEASTSQNLETRNKTSGEKLSSFLDEISGIDTLRKTYDDAAASGRIVFGNVDGESLLNEVATSLGNLLRKKVEALKAAVGHAENLTEEYVWNKNLKSVGYLHANEINESAESFEYNSQYRQIVSLDNSSVHIPVDIYKGRVDILNSIAWTDGLNEVWIKNKENDPSILWQYFGSQTGALRTYPASLWQNNSTLGKLYDVRRRPWYTQGISSPKDMLILIEKSGSAHGQGLELMKHSVRSIMETLGENDFVDIAQFSDKAGPATCFSTFVQATDRNRKKMISYLDAVTAGQVANYTKGFEYAFNRFANFSSSNGSGSEGASCNQLIVLFTDGGSEVPEEIFRKYNSDKKIRIFTFAVGPVTSTLPLATKQIGCMNKGNFSQLPAMGAIRSRVQRYLSILANPFALEPIWTSVHRDSMHLGFTISVTMPVFNRSQAMENQTILGVMGVDVSIKEMMDAVPKEKLGPNGYAFAINSNGIVLFHPDFKGEENNISIPMIDFAEIEDDIPSKEKIRTDMIDQVSNKVTITDFVVGLDKNHAVKRERTYHYAAIPGTRFSVAIVLPDYAKHYVESTGTIDLNLESGQKLLLSNFSKIVIDLQKYCQSINRDENVTYTPSSSIEEFLGEILDNISDCNRAALQQLLFDASITSSLEEFWIKKQMPQTENAGDTNGEQNHNSNNTDDSGNLFNDGLISTFVATNNDFIRVFPRSAGDFFDEKQLEPSKASYYKRSFDSDGWIFSTYPNKTIENSTSHHIMATKAVSLKSNNYKIAVVGVQLTAQRFHDLFSSFSSECASSDDLSVCYIVDDGGFIFSSSEDDLDYSVGKFLGDMDAELMTALIADNVFERHKKLYFQEVCEEENDNSAGFRLLPPFIYEILSLNWWTTASTWSYLSLMNIYSWLFTQVPDVEALIEEPPKLEPCIIAEFQYYLNDTEITSTIECNNCTRSYRTFQLEGTNLLVVSVDGEPCQCDRIETFKTSETASDPLIDESDDGHTCTIGVRYRRRPPCYKDNPYEPDSYCTASSLTATFHLCLILALSTTLARLL